MKITRTSCGQFAVTASVEERFWGKVKKTNLCWEWLGGKHGGDKPYGVFKLPHKCTSAHRAAYEFVKGVVPKGFEIDHLCRNRLCVNPDHLEAVTHAENMHRAKKTLCHRGHVMANDNLYISPKGTRGCRKCRRLAQDKYMEKYSENS